MRDWQGSLPEEVWSSVRLINGKILVLTIRPEQNYAVWLQSVWGPTRSAESTSETHTTTLGQSRSILQKTVASTSTTWLKIKKTQLLATAFRIFLTIITNNFPEKLKLVRNYSGETLSSLRGVNWFFLCYFREFILPMAVTCLRRSVVGLSQRRPLFDSIQIHLKFEVDKVALEEDSFRALRFFLSVLFHHFPR